MDTPAKEINTNLTQSLTPVRFLSTTEAKPIIIDSTSAICQNRLEQIGQALIDNYTKWRLAQKRGLSLCSSIEAIKTRSLETITKVYLTPSVTDTTLYPKELQAYCDQLAIITSIFVNITASARESLKQLRSFSKRPDSGNGIFYRTWQLPQFLEFVERLTICYAQEAQVKQHVMQDLPHCNSRSELIRCVSAWEYPQYVDEWIALSFAFLEQELSITKK